MLGTVKGDFWPLHVFTAVAVLVGFVLKGSACTQGWHFSVIPACGADGLFESGCLVM